MIPGTLSGMLYIWSKYTEQQIFCHDEGLGGIIKQSIVVFVLVKPEACSISDQEYRHSPLDGMLVHRKVTPSIMIAGTHLYTWVKRDNVE